MPVRPWKAEIRFHKTGKMGPKNSGAGIVGSRQFCPCSYTFHWFAPISETPDFGFWRFDSIRYVMYRAST